MYDVSTVEYLLKNYAKLKSNIEVAYANSDNKNYFDGYSNYHTYHYLHETLTGEGNIDGSTTITQLEEYIKKPDDTRVCKKIINLKNALDKLFPNYFGFVDSPSRIDVEKFTPEFICELHEQVARDLLKDGGIYRTTWAAPSQEDWVYLVPEKISENLIKLCDSVRCQLNNERLTRPEDIFVNRIKIAATFLLQFLQIHPFTNGNGRVARLLTSWLMTDISLVPVPLLTNSKSREKYLQSLRDCRYMNPPLPTNLARLIMESVVHMMRKVCFSLDI